MSNVGNEYLSKSPGGFVDVIANSFRQLMVLWVKAFAIGFFQTHHLFCNKYNIGLCLIENPTQSSQKHRSLRIRCACVLGGSCIYDKAKPILTTSYITPSKVAIIMWAGRHFDASRLMWTSKLKGVYYAPLTKMNWGNSWIINYVFLFSHTWIFCIR